MYIIEALAVYTDRFVLSLNTEIQLTLSIGFKSLEFSISMPTKFENLTRGLLGNFNGNKNDDFVLPNGQILNSNITDRQIFEIFGPACMLLCPFV